MPSALGCGVPAQHDRSVPCDRATYLTTDKGVEVKEERSGSHNPPGRFLPVTRGILKSCLLNPQAFNIYLFLFYMYKYKIACMYLVTTEARAGWNRNYKWL